jgi:HPt (histidine-containing phosphotransfer) domain-containing protein
LDPKKLFAAIETLAHPVNDVADEPEPEPEPVEVIDQASLMNRVGGKIELVRKINEIFLDKYPRQLSEIRSAIADGDTQKLSNVAHALKGTLGNLSAVVAMETAKSLEAMGSDGDLSRAEETCTALEAQIEQFNQALSRLLEGA